MADPTTPSSAPSSAPSASKPEAVQVNPVQNLYDIYNFKYQEVKGDPAQLKALNTWLASSIGDYLATEQGRDAILDFAKTLRDSEKKLIEQQQAASADQINKQRELEYQLGLLEGQALKKATDKTTDMQASASSAMAGMIGMAPMIVAACDIFDKTGQLGGCVLEWFETRGVEVAQRLSAVAQTLEAAAPTAGTIKKSVVDANGNRIVAIGRHGDALIEGTEAALERGYGVGMDNMGRSIISAAAGIADSQGETMAAVNVQGANFNQVALVEAALRGMAKEGVITPEQYSNFSSKLLQLADGDGTGKTTELSSVEKKALNNMLGPDLETKMYEREPRLRPESLPSLQLDGPR